MAATNFTPISLYYTTTAAAAPVAGNLVSGELAINITDGKLYYKNNAGVVTLLASTSGASGDVVGPASATDNALARFDLTTGKLIQNSVGILSDAGILTGLTGLTSSGPITLSSLTSGRVTFAGASGLLTDSANLVWDNANTRLGIGGNPSYTLDVVGRARVGIAGSTPALTLISGANGSADVFVSNNTTGLRLVGGTVIGTDSQILLGGSASGTSTNIYFDGAVKTFRNTSGSSDQMVITSAGLVGIGTSSPGTKISIVATNAPSPTLGTASGGFSLLGDAGLYGVYAGVSDSGNTWFQAMRNNTATAYDLLLQPSGGNVGIGTTSPVAKLDVYGGSANTSISVRTDSFDGTYYAGLDFSTGGQGANYPQAQIKAVGANNYSANLIFSTQNSGTTNPLGERMRITSAGLVGIGTSSPSGKLQIDSTNVDPSATATGITLINSTSSQATNNGGSISLGGVYTGSSITQFGYILGAKANSTDGNYAGYLSFGTRPNGDVSQERMRIDSSGNVGIGTATAGTRLVLATDDTATTGQLRYARSADTSFYWETGRDNQLTGDFLFSNAAGGAKTERMRLDSSGNLGIGTTSQNERLRLNSSSAGQARMSISYQDSTISFYGSYSGIVGAGNATDTFLSSANVLAFGSGGTTERMRIDSSGNVGIGTNSPSSYVNGLTVAKSTTSGGDIALVKTDSGTTDQGGQSLRFFNYAPAGYGRVSGTKIGSIYFLASQPSSGGIQDAAAIECLAETQTGNSTSSQLAFYTATGATLVKAMTIDSQQNVGISTTNAAAFTIFPSKLVVGSGTGNQQITVYSGTTSEGNIIFADGTSGTQQYMGLLRYDHADNGMKFYTNGGTFGGMFNSIGDFLVGTTSNTTNGGFIFSPTYNGTGVSAAIFGHSSAGGNGNQYMIFNYNGTGIGSITQNGTTGVLYNITSDQRLKTNVVDAPSGNIDDIKVRSFDWIADGSHQEYGMVAQELIEVAPYAVNKPENPDEMMGVDYSKLVPMMIKEIQDLKAEVNQLKAKIGV